MKVLLAAIALAFCVLALSFLPAKSPDAVLGVWLVGRKNAKIEIFKQGNRYFGRIVWLLKPIDPETALPKTDKANPDARLRNRPLIGLNLLNNLKWDAKEKEWTDGYVYDPNSGHIYNCTAWLNERQHLVVRGYWGFLYKTEEWERVR